MLICRIKVFWSLYIFLSIYLVTSPQGASQSLILITPPSYERHHDIIPIKTYRDQTTGALKRHKSDEYLYADPQTTRPEMTRPPSGAGTETTPGKGVMSDQDPVYQDPADLTTPRARSCVTAHGVSLDEEGYVPHEYH